MRPPASSRRWTAADVCLAGACVASHVDAEAGAMTGDVVQVLDAECQATQRAVCSAVDGYMGIAAERAERIALEDVAHEGHGRNNSTGLRENVMRPFLKP